MQPLATVDDLAERLGRSLTSSEETRAEHLLAGASARVRTYTGQSFTEDTSTDTIRVRKGRVRLPQRPVSAVTAVASLTDEPISFVWLGDDLVQVSGLVAFDVEPWRTSPVAVTVTYTHGYDPIPADIVDVVCQMAGRALGTTPDDAAKIQESIAGYSYSTGGAAASGSLGMMADERSALDPYRRVVSSTQVLL